MKWLLAPLVALCTVVGCQDAPEAPVTKTPSAPMIPDGYPAPDPKANADEAENIKSLVAKQAAAKTAFEKNPSDEKLKKGYVDSSVALGIQYTYAETVDRKEKYKLALQYLKEALKQDPEHKDAKATHDQIVDIYKSMGRPVPGEG